MFEKDDFVMYGNAGACQILDVRKEKFGKEEELYYIMRPLNGESSTIYFPVASEKVSMRKLLTSSEAHQLISSLPQIESEWIEDDQARKAHFEQILREGNRRELAALVKACYVAREAKQKEGKKLHMVDERMMEKAQRLLHGELAQVLDIPVEEVISYIDKSLENLPES